MIYCDSVWNKKQLASKLSGGQKRLLSFVLTLIGRPSLLFWTSQLLEWIHPLANALGDRWAFKRKKV